MPALKVCSKPGCPQLTRSGRCEDCQREADHARGTASERGYGSKHRTFRDAVLNRDPQCRMPGCTDASTDADHYPLSRRDLEARGLDPNDPRHGRGLCSTHHKQETGRHQPGGWNAR